jgi:hypothetical protein
MRCGTRAALQAALRGLGLSGRLTTAFVERLNLTVRRSVAALAGRTWATMQEAPQLLLQLEWWRAYEHFVRPQASLRQALGTQSGGAGGGSPSARRQRTPAMAAFLTGRRSPVGDLLSCPLPAEWLGAT